MQTDLDWSHDRYVRITVSGTMTKSDLVRVMARLLQHPDYTKKNAFWDLRDGTMGLSIADLREIVGVLKLYRPDTEAFADRSALLVPGKLHHAMAQMFVTMARFLPVKYKVFNDWEAAEKFLLD